MHTTNQNYPQAVSRQQVANMIQALIDTDTKSHLAQYPAVTAMVVALDETMPKGQPEEWYLGVAASAAVIVTTGQEQNFPAPVLALSFTHLLVAAKRLNISIEQLLP